MGLKSNHCKAIPSRSLAQAAHMAQHEKAAITPARAFAISFEAEYFHPQFKLRTKTLYSMRRHFANSRKVSIFSFFPLNSRSLAREARICVCLWPDI